jgi:hypothetical protein
MDPHFSGTFPRSDFNTSSIIYSSPLTSPSAYQKALHRQSTVEHSTYLSPNGTRHSAAPQSYSNTSATSVITAFRELQAKQRNIENERIFALKERDELRQRIAESRRSQALWRSKAEIEATESFLRVRNSNDQLKYEYGDVEAKLTAEENKYNAIERHRTALHTMETSIRDDVTQNDAKVRALEHQNDMLRVELKAIEARTQQMDKVALRAPEVHRKYSESVQKTLDALEREISKVKHAKQRTLGKTAALQSYMDLIIKINSDLSDTLISREHTRAEILRLSGKVAPPHYTWPKEIPYTNIVDVINEAASATANAVFESSALNASQRAAQTIVRALSPGAKKGAAARRRQQQRINSNSSVGRTVEIVRREGEDDPRPDWLYHKPRPRSAPGDPRSIASPYNAKLDEFIEDVTEATGVEDVRRFSSSDRMSRSSSSTGGVGRERARSASAGRSSSRGRAQSGIVNQDVAAKVVQAAIDSTAALNRQLLNRSLTNQAATPRPRSASRANNTSYDSRDRSRTSTASSRSVARQGAVSYATRFAAAASAAAMATKVHNTPSPVRRSSDSPFRVSHRTVQVLDGPDAASSSGPASASASASYTDREHYKQPANKANFIPSGSNQNNEFNVVASVSKASRAAKQLNASLASK